MKKVIIVIAILFSIVSFSQEYKFGKVSKQELNEKFNVTDSSAPATYLYKKRRTYFVYINQEFGLETEVHERIKIYNKEGYDYATKKIKLYKENNNKGSVTKLKAYTYNLTDGKIEKTKLKSKGIFKTELHKYANETKFTLPNLKEGSVVEYRYTIKSPFIYDIDEYNFQASIPIKKLEAKFSAPEYFNFKKNLKGYLEVLPKRSESTGSITVKTKSHQLAGGKIETYENDFDYQNLIDSYSLTNVPALKDEPYVNNIDNYRSTIKYELSFTKFPNSSIKYYSKNWDDVIRTIYESSSFGGELNKSNYFKKDVDALIQGVSDPLTRAGLIFNHLKSKVKWNGYYGYITNDGVKKAYKQQSGNVAEINLMLTSMLRYAGLSANPVLVSTRGNGVPLFPTRAGFNYVVSAIELKNNVILLDATSLYSSPNVLPYRALNWEGRIVREHGSSTLVNLYPNKKTNTTYFISCKIEEQGNVKGKMRKILTNHKALNYREAISCKFYNKYTYSCA